MPCFVGRVGDALGTVGVSVKAGARYAAELDTKEPQVSYPMLLGQTSGCLPHSRSRVCPYWLSFQVQIESPPPPMLIMAVVNRWLEFLAPVQALMYPSCF